MKEIIPCFPAANRKARPETARRPSRVERSYWVREDAGQSGQEERESEVSTGRVSIFGISGKPDSSDEDVDEQSDVSF